MSEFTTVSYRRTKFLCMARQICFKLFSLNGKYVYIHVTTERKQALLLKLDLHLKLAPRDSTGGIFNIQSVPLVLGEI